MKVLQKHFFERKSSAGQTMIEILVTITVIAILSSLLLLYTRTGETQAELVRQADKLIFNLRKAQNLSILSQEFSGSGIPCGYGVHFESNAQEYIIFADLAPDPFAGRCDRADRRRNPNGQEDVERVLLGTGIKILSATAPDVVFIPPAPTTVISGGAGPFTEATITLATMQEPSMTRSIKVTEAGQITSVSP